MTDSDADAFGGVVGYQGDTGTLPLYSFSIRVPRSATCQRVPPSLGPVGDLWATHTMTRAFELCSNENDTRL